jgi:hypothetical protein
LPGWSGDLLLLDIMTGQIILPTTLTLATVVYKGRCNQTTTIDNLVLLFDPAHADANHIQKVVISSDWEQ